MTQDVANVVSLLERRLFDLDKLQSVVTNQVNDVRSELIRLKLMLEGQPDLPLDPVPVTTGQVGELVAGGGEALCICGHPRGAHREGRLWCSGQDCICRIFQETPAGKPVSS